MKYLSKILLAVFYALLSLIYLVLLSNAYLNYQSNKIEIRRQYLLNEWFNRIEVVCDGKTEMIEVTTNYIKAIYK